MPKKGYKQTLEHKQKLSESQKGSKSYWYGKHPNEETRIKLSVSKLGNKNSLGKNMREKHHNWKGINVGYTALHAFMRRYLPKTGYCQKCFSKDKKLQVANVTGIYNRDFINWLWLCSRCHVYLDGTVKNLDKGKPYRFK